MLRWVSIAPFDTPVVPPVYWMAARSSAGSTSASGTEEPALSRKRQNSESGSPASPATTMLSSGVVSRTAVTRGYADSWTMIVRAPELFRMCSSSRST